MTLATLQLIEAVERLNMTGTIGDGTVARLHELATLARLELTTPKPARVGQKVTLRFSDDPGPVAINPRDMLAQSVVFARVVVDRARAAHDVSTFGGGARLEEAQRGLKAAQAALDDYDSRPECYGTDAAERLAPEGVCDGCRYAHACLDI